MIRRILLLVFVYSFWLHSYAQDSGPLKVELGKISLQFQVDNSGNAEYAVFFGDQPVIKPSVLGFNLKNNDPFRHFKILRSERKTVDETWKPVWGEVSQIRNHYNQITIY